MRGSVYVHFPYCLAKCPYCDFVSYAKPRDAIDHTRYADAVISELEARKRALSVTLEIGSVFFGGGTPSLWEPSELGRVLEATTSTFATSPDLEVTVECNPTSLDRGRAEDLVRVGVNRLSIGAQSLRGEQLRYLGRLHDPQGALAAIDAALLAKVPRVSADLIFGLPEQTPLDAALQASTLASRGLRHVSAYQLTIEPGTLFGELAKRGRLPRASDGAVAESFLAIDLALSARGFGHYEISNYAQPGEEARHNLGYWRGDPYVGLGCGAYGSLPTTQTLAPALRYRNEVDPEKYMAKAISREPTTIVDEPLDAEVLLRERIMLGLRLESGFDLDEAGAELGAAGWTEARRKTAHALLARGRLLVRGGRLALPPSARLFADDVAARLF